MKSKTTSAKPILLTGSHRSGSTWLGKMIAKSPKVGYIHEPFNLEHRPGICNAKFENWFTYICEENEVQYLESLQKTINFDYSLISELHSISNCFDLLKLAKDTVNYKRLHMKGCRPLLKDPIAFFSAEWLCKKFNMDVIVLIRHPAAFVASLKLKNWSFPFTHFLRQPLLLERYLQDYEETIIEFSQTEKDIVDQGILLWLIIHSTIIEYNKKHRDWFFIKHEDISKNPRLHFSSIFSHVNLELSDSLANRIFSYSRGGKYSFPRPWKATQIRRNSIANINSWKNRLTSEEITRIRKSVDSISDYFYDSTYW